MIIKGRLQGTCKIIELTKLHNIMKRREKIQSQLPTGDACMFEGSVGRPFKIRQKQRCKAIA